jgi:translation initiation factor IF-3
VDDHDYDTKKNHVLRFLGEGDKVKATIFFRGREMTRQGLGRGILDRLIQDLGDKAIVEFRPRQEGNTLHLILAPPKTQAPAKPAAPKAEKSATPRPPQAANAGPEAPKTEKSAAAQASPPPPQQQ